MAEQTKELIENTQCEYRIELEKLPVKHWGVRKVQNEIWLFLNKILVKGWGIDERDYAKEDKVSYSYFGTLDDCGEQRIILDKTFSKKTYLEPLQKSWDWLKTRFRGKKAPAKAPEDVSGWEDLQEKVAAFGIVITEDILDASKEEPLNTRKTV